MAYVILNVAVLLAIVLVLWRMGVLVLSKAVWLTMVIVLLLTAVFDSLIIWAEIVAYAPETLLGIYIGRAPIEDFFYTIAVVLLMPALWQKIRRRHANA